MTESSEKNDGQRKFPTILRAELAGGYFNKFVVFVIETPKGETILRRYTDFEWLRSWLVSLYPGAFIPPIPPKLPVTMWPAGYLLSRKKELQQFLQRIQIIRYLESEEIVKFFLQPNDQVKMVNKEADLTNNSASFEKARKEWDNVHKKPSFNAQFENLCQKFPGVHKTETPPEMDKRNTESKKVVTYVIKHLEEMEKACESFVRSNEDFESTMIEMSEKWAKMCNTEKNGVTQNMSTNESLESGHRYCTEVRLPLTNYLSQWTGTCHDELVMIRTHMLPVIKRSLFDMQVVDELVGIRDDLLKQHEAAKQAAAKWVVVEEKSQLRSSHIEAKNRDVAKEADLRKLSEMVSKLVLDQLNIVWEANIRRFARAAETVISMHTSTIKKILLVWQELVSLAGGSNVIHTIEFKAHSDDTQSEEKKIIDDDNNQNEDQSTNVSVVNVIQENSTVDSATKEENVVDPITEPWEEKEEVVTNTESASQDYEYTTNETNEQAHVHQSAFGESFDDEQTTTTTTTQHNDAQFAEVPNQSSYNPFDVDENVNPTNETVVDTKEPAQQVNEEEPQRVTNEEEAIDVSFLDR